MEVNPPDQLFLRSTDDKSGKFYLSLTSSHCLYRGFDGFVVKAYANEDEGYQEGAASQEMESFSTETETKPSSGTDDLTSPGLTHQTFNSNL